MAISDRRGDRKYDEVYSYICCLCLSLWYLLVMLIRREYMVYRDVRARCNLPDEPPIVSIVAFCMCIVKWYLDHSWFLAMLCCGLDRCPSVVIVSCQLHSTSCLQRSGSVVSRSALYVFLAERIACTFHGGSAVKISDHSTEISFDTRE